MVKEKDKIQLKALELSRNNNAIVLEWATGTGKTFASVKIIDDIIRNNKSAFGYLLCKESTHLKNWLEDIKVHNMNHILSNLDSLLYASLHKINKKADFIILDRHFVEFKPI